MIKPHEAAIELLNRRRSKTNLYDYIKYIKPNYIQSYFAETVCAAIDKFIIDVHEGKRPVLVFQCPPQHGKSEIASRCLPAYLMGRFPHLRIGAASYSAELAGSMAQEVRRNLADSNHQTLFKSVVAKTKFDVSRMGEFSAPGGLGGSYIGVGVGGGLTGRSVDIGIIDDAIKNEKEALSDTIKESHWGWYQSVWTTRLSEKSGQIIIGTSWAQDDLPARILSHFAGDPRLTHLRFPALNRLGETGYDPSLPEGALVPALHSEDKLKETKLLFSDYFWSAIYQQNPKPMGGLVFVEEGIQYWNTSTLPSKFEKKILSIDCTFKDTDGTDYVVGQVWGKVGTSAYLLDQFRNRMSFTKTCSSVLTMYEKWRPGAVLIEDKANGPAVIDTLTKVIAGIIPIEPDGSKLARAHAITHVWEGHNVYIPDPKIHKWVTDLTNELTSFPASANDDQVDALTQALRYLFPLRGKLNISAELLKQAGISNY